MVHVAGTKGKGSTCDDRRLARGCGYTVGLYTSPHLVDLRERAQINGHMITEKEFRAGMDAVAAAAAAVEGKHGEATFFELITALAFHHFAEKAVDIGVIEVGLGGRLDATNIVRPDVAVVTEISRDHTQILGETLPEIGREKAGIFKPRGAAITMPQAPGVLDAMEEVAARRCETRGPRTRHRVQLPLREPPPTSGRTTPRLRHQPAQQLRALRLAAAR